MPTVIPPWLEASKAPDTYSAMLPEAFKLGAQSDQFAKELALKRSEQQDQMLRAGANLGLESGQQANAMAMNVANLRQQQEEQAQKMQLAWQEEASRIAAEAARLDEAAYQNDLEAAIQQQRIRQESLERLARTDIEREYKKNQYSLGKQKLNDLAAQNKLKNDALAKKAENILNYQRELAAAPTEETRLAVAQKWFPLIGMTGASVSGLFRPKAQPRAETIPGPQGSRLERFPDGSWKQIVAPGQANQLNRAEEAKLADARATLRRARADAIDPMKRIKQDEINKIIDEARTTINALEKKAGIGPAPAAGEVASPETKGVEVRRRTKDGRVAVFDSATKKFLRYAD